MRTTSSVRAAAFDLAALAGIRLEALAFGEFFPVTVHQFELQIANEQLRVPSLDAESLALASITAERLSVPELTCEALALPRVEGENLATPRLEIETLKPATLDGETL